MAFQRLEEDHTLKNDTYSNSTYHRHQYKLGILIDQSGKEIGAPNSEWHNHGSS